jgi:hypothetical protein
MISGVNIYKNISVNIQYFTIQLGQEIFLSPELPNWFWGLLSRLFDGHWGSFPVLKRPGCEVDHLPLTSSEVKNKWSYTSAPPICICGMYKDFFFFGF